MNANPGKEAEMTEHPKFRDHVDRESKSVAWQAPDGTKFFVYRTEKGFSLYSAEEFGDEGLAYYFADLEGHVFFQEEPAGWTIPADVLERAD